MFEPVLGSWLVFLFSKSNKTCFASFDLYIVLSKIKIISFWGDVHEISAQTHVLSRTRAKVIGSVAIKVEISLR